MAERRMFAKTIVLSDAFLDMPMSARCLYFTLGMLADDDGFVNSPRSIMRQCGASDDDMRILLTKKFVLIFDSGVIVIKHWRMNNYLQNDRHKTTNYKEELSQLAIDKNGAYSLNQSSEIPVIDECIQNVYTGKDRLEIGKVSIESDKVSIDKVSHIQSVNTNNVDDGRQYPSLIDIQGYAREIHSNLDPKVFWQTWQSKGWVDSKGIPINDWKAMFRYQSEHGITQPAKSKSRAIGQSVSNQDIADFIAANRGMLDDGV